MKLITYFKLTAILLASAFLSSCDTIDQFSREKQQVDIKVSLTSGQPLTRTSIATDDNLVYYTSWEVGDAVGIYTVPVGEGGASNHNRQFSISDDESITIDGKAVFSGSLASGTFDNPLQLYGYYPHNGQTESGSHTAVQCIIPSEQTMQGESHDPNADFMISKPVMIDGLSTEGANQQIDNLTFDYLTTFIKVSVKEITLEDSPVTMDDNVVAVLLEAEGASAPIVLSGEFTLDLTTGEMTFPKSGPAESAAVLSSLSIPAKLSDFHAWVVANPFDLTPADKLHVTVITENHTITKTISGVTRSHVAGGIKTLNMIIDSDCTIASRGATPDALTFNYYSFPETYTKVEDEYVKSSEGGEQIYYRSRYVKNGTDSDYNFFFWYNISYLYNTTSLGKITSIELTYTGNTTVSYVEIREGDSEAPSQGNIVKVSKMDGNLHTYNMSGTCGYFYIKGATGSSQFFSIKVNYEK